MTDLQQKKYVASLTNSGRAGWSIIFRHPVLVDPTTGEPPLRIKRGLGTQDEVRAISMANDLNTILSDPSYWNLSARSTATPKFNPRVVDIFFSPMAPTELSYAAHREKVIKLPTVENGYKQILVMGTTGAGKTTLVRQILGTDPDTERFPSIGAGRCTTAETEIVLSEGPFRAVVTFSSMDEIREAVDECISSAIIAAYRKSSDAEIMRKMLTHVDLRFRFNYVLGNGGIDEEEEDDDELDSLDTENGLGSEMDLLPTNEVLRQLLTQVKMIANRYSDTLTRDLVKSETDQMVADELFEEELDTLLKGDLEYQEIGTKIMAEIKRRFELLDENCLEYSRQDWPISWRWQNEDRSSFLKEVRRFSSNYAPWFGTLLTPLVNGIRVSGPFIPHWLDERPNLVLIDGEGLSHSAESSSTIPSALIERFDAVDAIILVDNAQQPMLAAPIACLRAILSSGNIDKLLIAFTHFDEVKAPNLRTSKDRQNQVLSIAENAIRYISNQLGPQAERDLRRRIESACFYLDGINENIDINTKTGKKTATALRALIESIRSIGTHIVIGEASPVFDRLNLAMAIRDATQTFHEDWRGLLGLSITPRTSKVHWAKVKALNRRIAEGWAEEYGSLTPVGDLWGDLREQIYVLIKRPVDWRGPSVNDEEAQKILDRFANQVSGKLVVMVRRRIRLEMIQKWQEASKYSGSGSTFDRARTISNDIYMVAAPIPSITPTADKNAFYREVIQVVEEAAAECNVIML